MVTVFIVQGVMFQDGGLTVLKANIFNMGLIGTYSKS
nr:energy-coupling factor ABC transporter permease [Komarekiella delphini-convector]